ncbi:MAG: polysaccharide biosynthesis C-terminal domain-containing protein, partial [Parcubacteria group bacterium]
EFILSGDILKVLILASGAIFLTSLFGYGVIAVEKQKKITWAYLIAAIITLAGYLIYIPQYGYWAAAWWTVFSETLIAVWSAILLYKTIKFFPSLRLLIKSVAAGLIMAVVLYVVRDLQVLISLAIAIVVYFGCLYLLGGIKRESVMELLKINK